MEIRIEGDWMAIILKKQLGRIFIALIYLKDIY
jgi:hypothetical protein